MPSFEEDANLASLVHSVVSNSNELAEAIDKVMKDPADVYHVPPNLFAEMAELLRTDAKLISKLYEENQSLIEGIKMAADTLVRNRLAQMEEGQS
jgi:hypothetical protein